jgi:hypothetical protein
MEKRLKPAGDRLMATWASTCPAMGVNVTAPARIAFDAVRSVIAVVIA